MTDKEQCARQWLATSAALAALTSLGACEVASDPDSASTVRQSSARCLDKSEPVQIAGGTFTMGSETAYREEGPLREVSIEGFAISATEVTNAQFAEFVEATGYVTQAERAPDPALHPDIPAQLLVPGSAVFRASAQPANGNWWHFVEGASWKAPEGPRSSLDGRAHHPVIHVSYEDALAYAKWAGGDLPTEEQWEFAARGGLDQATYEWGEEEPHDGKSKANTWQGVFPIADQASDGYSGTAPVGCFDANAYGLYDMTGNVWEWTKGSPDKGNSNAGLVKGGSYLCADNYCARFRPAAKQAQERDFSTSHIGFRVVFP